MTISGVGADGTKVTETVNGDAGAKIDITGKNGATSTMTTNAAGTTIQGTDDKGNKVNEAMGAGAVSEADLGVPFYPGSEESKDAGMTVVSQGPNGKTAMSSRLSKDAPSKVIDFYKDKIPGGKTASMTLGEGSMSSISGKLANGAQISVTATNDGKKDTVVMVSATTPKS